jgi:hypothetical protein
MGNGSSKDTEKDKGFLLAYFYKAFINLLYFLLFCEKQQMKYSIGFRKDEKKTTPWNYSKEISGQRTGTSTTPTRVTI